MKKFIVFLLIAVTAFTIYSYWPEKELKHSPGILVVEAPLQKNLNGTLTWQKNGYTFKALAEFNIKARVLSRSYYRSDKESDISPVDFALGWGPMSDQIVLDQINISQRNRWYFWKADVYPIPRDHIISNSANMHIIPADESVEKLVKDVYKGCLIEITGYLVEVIDGKGWRWKSSLSRDDTGGGSCEVVWVDEIKVLIGD